MVWLHSRGTVLRDEAGRPRQVVGVAFDVTGEKEHATLLQRQSDELRGLSEELRTFDRMVQALRRETSLPRLLALLLEQGRVLFPQAEKAVCFVLDAEEDRYEVAASSGWEPELLRGLSLTPEEAARRYGEAVRSWGRACA